MSMSKLTIPLHKQLSVFFVIAAWRNPPAAGNLVSMITKGDQKIKKHGSRCERMILRVQNQ